jgi:hypothetical protein
MINPGKKIEMTKGYKGIEGIILEETESPYEFYIVALNNGINIIAGPSAFIEKESNNNG